MLRPVLPSLLTMLATFMGTGIQQLSAQPDPVDHQNLENGLALQGYDPVSYFDTRPQKGKTTIASEYRGIKFYFSSDHNKRRFNSNPSAYLPQYGGWCAYAMGATGEKVSVDPQTYKIIAGRLYLFYNRFFNNTLLTWNTDEKRLLSAANSNWQLIIQPH